MFNIITDNSVFRISLESQFKERCVKLPSNKYELIVQQRRRYLLQTGKILMQLNKINILFYLMFFVYKIQKIKIIMSTILIINQLY